MSTAVYVRVSTTSQNEAGQVAAIKRWLKGNKHGKVVWYIDKATGSNLDRPAFTELQQAVFNGEVDTIVVYKLDRISRSLRDGIVTLTDWLDKSIRVVAITQQLDFSGTTGKLIASTLFAVAEMEQETRRERQAEGIAVAKKRGVYMGRKKGTTTTDTSRAVALKDKGLKITEIAQALGVTRQTVNRHLRIAGA